MESPENQWIQPNISQQNRVTEGGGRAAVWEIAGKEAPRL